MTRLMYICLMILFFFTSCDDRISKKSRSPSFLDWRKVNIELNETLSSFQNNIVYSLSRSSTSKPSYVCVNVSGNVDNINNEYYEMSVLVKKDKGHGLFGMRISTTYLNRVDVIFNLNDGTVKEVKSVGKYTDEKGLIKLVKNGWYDCRLIAKGQPGNVEILMGPTANEKRVSSWEGNTVNLSSVYILPHSLNFKIYNKK